MNDKPTVPTLPFHFAVEFDEADLPQELAALVDGRILDPAVHGADDAGPGFVILRGMPIEKNPWIGLPRTAWVAEGLEETARCRDRFPDLAWVPRTGGYRPQVIYEMGDRYPGEGFRVFVPDTAAIRGFNVSDGEQTADAWLARATELGFVTVWLHGFDAAEKGNGLDLELLERARRNYKGGLWLSGGATEPRHLATLRAEGGAQAAIVATTVAAAWSLEELSAALGRELPLQQFKRSSVAV